MVKRLVDNHDDDAVFHVDDDGFVFGLWSLFAGGDGQNATWELLRRDNRPKSHNRRGQTKGRAKQQRVHSHGLEDCQWCGQFHEQPGHACLMLCADFLLRSTFSILSLAGAERVCCACVLIVGIFWLLI